MHKWEGEPEYPSIECHIFNIDHEIKAIQECRAVNEPNRSVIYRYPKGHIHFRTSTVAELVEFLQQFPADMPVLAELEGMVKGFGDFSVVDIEGRQSLIIDVESDITKED